MREEYKAVFGFIIFCVVFGLLIAYLLGYSSGREAVCDDIYKYKITPAVKYCSANVKSYPDTYPDYNNNNNIEKK